MIDFKKLKPRRSASVISRNKEVNDVSKDREQAGSENALIEIPPETMEVIRQALSNQSVVVFRAGNEELQLWPKEAKGGSTIGGRLVTIY